MSGIYIHIPFCKQNCYYCDFHFSVSHKNKPEMVQAIAKELFLRKNVLKSPIETIYFGGGTPSVLDLYEIEFILKNIYDNYTVSKNLELTLEANPDDLDKTFVLGLKELGFNRLSIGIQSFFDDDLKFMHRAHNTKEALQSIKTAQQVGITNITIDLIYGVPGLTLEKWKQNLKTFIDLGIPHLSSYALTVEPNTVLAHRIKKKKYPPVDENLAKTHFDILVNTLKSNNYIHYELSNFAKKGFFSKHNTAYWKTIPYLGIGPSAHSFYNNTRSWNIAHNKKYIDAINKNKLPLEIEELTKENQYNEYIMTGLRTIWGIDLKKIKTNFGDLFYNHILTVSKRFIDNKQLIIADKYLKVAPDSLFLIDGIISDLFII